MSKGLLETVTGVFKPQIPAWSCELTSRHVIMAGLARRRNQIAAKATAELPAGSIVPSQGEPNIRNFESARSTVRDMLRDTGMKGSEIAVVVPDDTARIAFLTADKISKKREDLRTFIRWKLKKTVPFDADSAQVAYRILGPHPNGNGIDMLVALSPKSIVQEYENLFDALDLHAGMVVPSTLAALSLLQPPAGDALFLKVAPDCITTTIFQRQRMQFYRRVSEVPLYDAVYPTVMYYQDKLGGKALQHFFVCGYDIDLRPALAEIREKLGFEPQRLEPKSVDDIFKPVLGSSHLSWQGLI